MAKIVDFPHIKRLPDSRVVDIAGQKFGKLTVLGYAGKDERTKTGGAMWMCRCDCGTMHRARGGQLRAGKVKTCGKCRKRGGDIAEAIASVVPPPCERNCPHWDACADRDLACHMFLRWVADGEKVLPDPERYPPNRAIYKHLFGDEQQDQRQGG